MIHYVLIVKLKRDGCYIYDMIELILFLARIFNLFRIYTIELDFYLKFKCGVPQKRINMILHVVYYIALRVIIVSFVVIDVDVLPV